MRQEKRNSKRRKVRIRCELSTGRRRGPATVMDVSTGGLAVQTRLPLKHGQAVSVELVVPGRAPIHLEARVGNTRTVKIRASGDRTQVIGLEIADAPPMLQALALSGTAPPVEPGVLYVVSARQPGSEELCSLTVEAASEHEAMRMAKIKLGEPWQVLEVEPAS